MLQLLRLRPSPLKKLTALSKPSCYRFRTLHGRGVVTSKDSEEGREKEKDIRGKEEKRRKGEGRKRSSVWPSS